MAEPIKTFVVKSVDDYTFTITCKKTQILNTLYKNTQALFVAICYQGDFLNLRGQEYNVTPDNLVYLNKVCITSGYTDDSLENVFDLSNKWAKILVNKTLKKQGSLFPYMRIFDLSGNDLTKSVMKGQETYANVKLAFRSPITKFAGVDIDSLSPQEKYIYNNEAMRLKDKISWMKLEKDTHDWKNEIVC